MARNELDLAESHKESVGKFSLNSGCRSNRALSNYGSLIQ